MNSNRFSSWFTAVAVVIIVGFGAVMFSLADGFGGNAAAQPPFQDEPQLGAVSVLSSPLEVGGTVQYRQAISMRTASTTVCSFKNPNATTTVYFSGNFRTSPAYAQQYTLALGNSPIATTSQVGNLLALGSGGSGLIVATSTLMSPGQFLNLRYASTTDVSVGSEFAPTGRCVFIATEL